MGKGLKIVNHIYYTLKNQEDTPEPDYTTILRTIMLLNDEPGLWKDLVKYVEMEAETEQVVLMTDGEIEKRIIGGDT